MHPNTTHSTTLSAQRSPWPTHSLAEGSEAAVCDLVDAALQLAHLPPLLRDGVLCTLQLRGHPLLLLRQQTRSSRRGSSKAGRQGRRGRRDEVRWHACTKRAAIGSPPPSTPGPSRPAHLLQGRDFLARALGLLCRTLLVNLQQLQVALQPRDARSQLLLRRHQLPRRRQRAQLLLRRRLLLQQRKQRGGDAGV